MDRATIRMDDPNDGYSTARGSRMVVSDMLELGLLVLSIVAFVVLDLYVVACEKV